MSVSDRNRDYHAARARAELESAYCASRPEAAALHLELSSMHLRRALSFGPLFGQRLAGELGWLHSFAPAHGHWLQAGNADPAKPFIRHERPLLNGPTAKEAAASGDAEVYGNARRNLAISWPATAELTA
ncbi:hypothetical protein [Sphingosinicella rhizophila]|uniref:Uncharacterized protein n=1 Tax=Sphingosinicella rhizophila TaxID=3050082 RepID=A0ABU3Q6D9_9SPHN|nr:hypothetical protein [Sphingosinicella sp. GR2756]MDT9598970.1 hypothetical protein [Sphingosinicella sp. GR2756]